MLASTNSITRHLVTWVVLLSLQTILSATEEGTLLSPVTMPLTAQGKQIGNLTLPAGTKVQVLRKEGAKTLIKNSTGETWVDSAAITTTPIPTTPIPASTPVPPVPETVQPKPAPTVAHTVSLDAQVIQKPAPVKTASAEKGSTTDPLVSPSVWTGGQLPGEWEETASGQNWQIKTWIKPEQFFGVTPLTGKAEYRDGKLVRIDLSFIDRFAPFPPSPEMLKIGKEIEEVDKTFPFDSQHFTDAKKRLEAATRPVASDYIHGTQKRTEEIVLPISSALRRAYPDDKWKFGGNVLGDKNLMLVMHAGTDATGSNPDFFGVTISRRAPANESAKAIKPETGDSAAALLAPEFWARSETEYSQNIEKPLFGAVPQKVTAHNKSGNTTIQLVKISYLMAPPIRTPQADKLQSERRKNKDSSLAEGLLQEELKMRRSEIQQARQGQIEKYLALERTILGNLLTYFPASWLNASPSARFRKFSSDAFYVDMVSDENYLTVHIELKKQGH